jgi:hypothetical protein
MTSLKHIGLAVAWAAALLLPALARADVVISSDPTQSITCANGTCTPTSRNSVLNINDLVNLLGAGNVTIYNYFYTKHPHSGGQIQVNVPLSWATANTLTLEGDPAINAPLTIMGTGTLNVTNTYNGLNVNAAVTIEGTGALALRYFVMTPNGSVTFWDLGATFTIDGTPVTLVGDLPTLAADIATANGAGLYALANDYDAKADVFQKAPIPIFSGNIYGLGHTIANLTIKKGYGSCQGLVSENYGQIGYLRLHVARIVSAKSRYIGAIAGCNNYGSIYNVSVDGTISGSTTTTVGAIAGVNFGNISNASATVSITSGVAGGIAGENDGDVYYAYATGSVTGTANTGGVVGANKGRLGQCYSTVPVNGSDGTVGGLAGFNGGTITDCYSIGAVSGTGTVGGFVGYDPLEGVSNGYWDLETSGISDPNQGAGLPKDDTGMTGLTTAQLQAHRLPFGFSKAVWGHDANINNGFPFLRAMPPQ